jgi:hypothetical protein
MAMIRGRRSRRKHHRGTHLYRIRRLLARKNATEGNEPSPRPPPRAALPTLGPPETSFT